MGVPQRPAGIRAKDLGVAFLVFAQGFGVVGRHVAGGDGVDIDAVRREFVGHQPGQPHHGALGGGVGRDADAALEREHRGGVDDLAAFALLDHDLGHGLAEEEQRAQIDVDARRPSLSRRTRSAGRGG